ncbi:unnamed protein product [Oncorhynchus mykiss]|uniref:non-specific serine/threonine protein kinase n=1 Tax=Oncorhynchus mykiss TaxID=8022 RepID=A0A060X1S4_ONCMY|nr:unnamed protein product [Oncorhynchus mykiss]
MLCLWASRQARRANIDEGRTVPQLPKKSEDTVFHYYILSVFLFAVGLLRVPSSSPFSSTPHLHDLCCLGLEGVGSLFYCVSLVTMSNVPSSRYAAAISALSLSLPAVNPNPPLTPKSSLTPKSLTPKPLVDPTPKPPLTIKLPSYPPSPEIFGSDDEEQENPSDYCIGGYYPVEIGAIFIDRYQVVKKLGWGHFSTVWLGWDIEKRRFVALKVVKSAPTFTETGLDEIKLLKCVRDSDPSDPKRDTVVQLIDDFKVSGVNGEHVCMVLEVLGHQLLKWIIKSNYTGLPLPCVKSILRQVLQGLDYLHTKCKIIHTDIKPENILLRVDDVYVQELAADTNLQELPVSPAPTSFSGNLLMTSYFTYVSLTPPIIILVLDCVKLVGEVDCGFPDSWDGLGIVFYSFNHYNSICMYNYLCNYQKYLLKLFTLINSLKISMHCMQKGFVVLIFKEMYLICRDWFKIYLTCCKMKDTGKVSRIPRARLSRKGNKHQQPQQDEDTLVDRQKRAKAHVSFSNITTPCSTPSSTSPPKPSGPVRTTWRRNLLHEEAMGSDSKESVSSPIEDAPSLTTMSHCSRQSTVLHPSTQRDNQPSSPSHDIRNTFRILSSNSFCPHNSLNLLGHGLYEVSSIPQGCWPMLTPMLPTVVSNWLAVLWVISQITLIWDHSFHFISMSWKEQVFLMFCMLSVYELYLCWFSETDMLVNLLKPQNADEISIKIADLGNACWVYKHFTEDIQTCQYRSVEVLIGAGYGTPADIWSTACMAFELATGEYLFEPHSGDNFSREEDHIAHIIELLGPLPSQFALSGRNSRRYFNHKGHLRRISRLKPWSLCEILLDKYEWPRDQAVQFSAFLLTMLEPLPEKRATAAQCLKHPWISS